MSARIAQLNVSRGGVPKAAVAIAHVTASGLDGDGHRNEEHHGGPERAVCLYALEALRGLQAEGHDVAPGALGENVTVEGLDWETVGPGARLLLGEVVLLEVTRYTTPCTSIMRAFKDGEYSRVSQKRHPGWSRVYARVLRGGVLRPGDAVRVLDAREAAPVVPP